MALDLSEFEAFNDALRRTTGLLLIVEAALGRSAVLAGRVTRRWDETAPDGAIDPAVFRPNGFGGRSPRPEAEVMPAGGPALPTAAAMARMPTSCGRVSSLGRGDREIPR